MEIVRGRAGGGDAQQRGATFTGEVWADPVMATPDGTTVNSVFFTPGAHTFWHFHERGQLLTVTSGTGLICSSGGRPQTIGVGDNVWVPAGEHHWHGAMPGTCLCHLAVSLGVTTWGQEVTPEEYGAAPAARLDRPA